MRKRRKFGELVDSYKRWIVEEEKGPATRGGLQSGLCANSQSRATVLPMIF